jgi:hypothetical protein
MDRSRADRAANSQGTAGAACGRRAETPGGHLNPMKVPNDAVLRT